MKTLGKGNPKNPCFRPPQKSDKPNEPTHNRRLNVTAILLLTSLLLFIAFVVFVAYQIIPDSLSNMRNLSRMKDELLRIPIPAQTQRLSTKTAFGILGGNGNHCDYFVGLIFRSSLTPEVIKQHYSGRTFLNPVTASQEAIQVSVLRTPKDLRSSLVWIPDSFEELETWGISAQDFSLGTLYLVSTFQSYPPNGDCRCH